MSVYIIAQVSIHDRAEYDEYAARFRDVFRKFKGALLAVSDNASVIDGEWPYTRTILMRFPSAAEARRWYESPEYKTISEYRRRGAKVNAVVVEALPT